MTDAADQNTVSISLDEGQVLYFEQERVVGGLIGLLKRGHIDECVHVLVRCPPVVIPALVQAARQHGVLDDAANVLFRVRDFSTAAQVCVELGQAEKAALLYERGGQIERAAALHEQLGHVDKAAMLFAQAGQTARSVALLLGADDKDEAAHVLWRAGDGLGAAQFFLDEDKPELALDVLLSTMTPADAQSHRAVLLGKALIGCSAPRLAVAPLMQAVVDDTLDGALRVEAVQAVVQHNLPLEDDAHADLKRAAEALSVDLPDDDDTAKNRRTESSSSLTAGILQRPGLHVLLQWPLLADLPLDDVRQLHALCEVRRFHKDEWLLLQGQPSAALHLLLDGEVEVRNAQGSLLATLGPGEHLGEMSLFDGEPVSADVQATSSGQALVLQQEAFDRFFSGAPDRAQRISRHFLRVLSQRLRATSQRVQLGASEDGQN